jgi:hypothetical protein
MPDAPKHARNMSDAEYAAARAKVTGQPLPWRNHAPPARSADPGNTAAPTPSSGQNAMDMPDEVYLAARAGLLRKV